MRWELPLLLFVAYLLLGKATPRVAPKGSGKELVLSAFESHGWPRDEANAVVRIESGWKPSAIHPTSHAVGLIQFLPSILPGVGWKRGYRAFSRLSAAQQAPYISRFLDRAPRGSGIPGDTYVLTAAPGFVGKPDETVVYDVGTPGWRANPGWRESPELPVTAGGLRRFLLSHL